MPPSTHSGRIEQPIENMGCKLLYLPSYSPYLNKIEQRRVKVKESHPRSSLIVCVLAIEDVLCFASGADESGCYT